ncbi:MAG: hypothetical protein B9S32_01215 [Verrucomicrobia bacterium Tous-C9LFEB]|nr:MAG: hypothetical protein B9S32_01215 [Verrucomicrobia bacterium Tous-C9LFEB]
MPSDTKTAPAAPGSLEGSVFECRNEQDLQSAINQAFEYRGDITLELTNGEKVEGYLFNRDFTGRPPRVQLYVKGSNEPKIVPCADIHSVAFSGSDPANGKSWRDWVTKKTGERQAEAERLRLESIQRGEL